ncbi:MAG TPA: hypothetical protein VF092_18300 [Longimicrobium sp.]
MNRHLKSFLDLQVPLALVLLIAAAALAADWYRQRQPARPSPAAAGEGTGTLEAAELARAAVPLCREEDRAAAVACYAPLLEMVAGAGGVGLGSATLREVLKQDPAMEGEAHMLSHRLGFAALRAGRDPALEFSRCTAEFHSGCHHGIIQAYFAAARQVTPRLVARACPTLTARAPTDWLKFQCLHGLGHGLAINLRYDVPAALALCDALSSDWERESCYGGTFMESSARLGAGHGGGHHAAGRHAHAAAPAGPAPTSLAAVHAGADQDVFAPSRAGDPQYPCSVVAERYRGACYLLQTSVILPLEGGDFARAARDCGQAPERYRAICFQSLGRDASGVAAAQDLQRIIRICSSIGEPNAGWCFFGAAKDVAYRRPSLDDGVRLCRHVPGKPSRSRCYEAIGELAVSLIERTGRRAEFCRSVEADYRADCRRGARV